MFDLFFGRMLQVYFIWMLHMSHTYVATVLSRCCVCFYNGFQMFLQVFQIHISSASSIFRHMLQVLHLDILKVDQVLNLPPRLLLPHVGVFFLLNVVLYPSQTAKEARRGMVAWTRAGALLFITRAEIGLSVTPIGRHGYQRESYSAHVRQQD
jgi:hypothetical protein